MKAELSYQKYLSDIGAKIAAKRHMRGEKLTTVASAVDMAYSKISQIEHGRYYSLKVTTMIRIAEYLDIPLKEILPPEKMMDNFDSG